MTQSFPDGLRVGAFNPDVLGQTKVSNDDVLNILVKVLCRPLSYIMLALRRSNIIDYFTSLDNQTLSVAVLDWSQGAQPPKSCPCLLYTSPSPRD